MNKPSTSRTKTIEVRKVKPVTCTLCDTAAEFYINYRDPAKPGEFHETSREGNRSTGYTDPTIGYRACAAHVVDVTYLLLIDARLAPKLPTENLKKEDAYVGTTDEPKKEG